MSKNQKDSILFETYMNVARYYFANEHQIDSVLKYANLSVQTAQNHNLSSQFVKAKLAMGIAYIDLKKYELAKKEFNEAMVVAKKNNNIKGIIDVNNKLGYLYGTINDLDKSIYYFLNTAKEYEKLSDYRNLALTYKNIVVIFTIQEQNAKIVEYTNKGLDLISKLNYSKDADVIADIYSGAAQHYFYLWGKEENKLFKDKALILADSCLNVATHFNIKGGMADSYYIKANHYLDIKEWRKALLYCNKAFAYREAMTEKTYFNFMLTIAKIYLEAGDFKKTKLYIDSCKRLPQNKMLENPFLIAQMEYHLYKNTGNFEAALKAYQTLTEEKLKLLNNKKNESINNLEVKYQTELKETEISKLNQQKEIDELRIKSLVGIISAIILLLLTLVFFYRQSTIKNKLKTIEIEQRLNRARMDPHFFFNMLASIQGLVNADHAKQHVSDYIANFSKIMRQSLESTYTEMATLENEIDFLSNYMTLQKLRTGNKFNFEFVYNPALEINEVLIPGMILQPFIENSIEHGFSKMESGGFISVTFIEQNSELLISITDNGSWPKEDLKHKAYPSRAIQIISDRLYLLNKKHKTNANFVMSKHTEKSGTKVQITLPLLS